MATDKCNKAQNLVLAAYHNGCCSGQSSSDCTSKNTGIDDDNCCDSKSATQDCNDNCRSSPGTSSTQHMGKPGCCENKPSPCCDNTCLDRVALRACEEEGQTARRPEDACRSDWGCHGGRETEPCGYHSGVTRDTYASTLEALGCICRALVALGQESCCIPKKRRSTDSRRCTKRRSTHSVLSTTAITPCTATGAAASSTLTRSRMGKGCSNAAQDTVQSALQKSSCCESQSSDITDLCTDEAYSKQEPNHLMPTAKGISSSTAHPMDLEKGRSGMEHIILSVSGLTCTGCETKLKRALGTMESVKNLKTSLILARAEFDLDLRSNSLAEVIKYLERTTEFKCEKLASHGSIIEIIVPVEPSDFIKQPWPSGVTEMTVVGQRTIRVSYDPDFVGARDLIEKGWEHRIELAAPRPDPFLEAGLKHVRQVGYMTLVSILLTIPVLVFAWAPLPRKDIKYDAASMALATLVQLVVAGPFYPKALKSLIFSRVIEMDLLIVLSTSAAYIFSVVSFAYLVAGRPLSTGEFFETSTLLVTLIMVGRYISAQARQKAVESISVRSLQISVATLVDNNGYNEKAVDVRLLQYGDIFKIAPESRIPTDGVVICGSSEVDESMITGESIPVEKGVGSAVIAGSMNASGTLIVRLTRIPSDNTISTIAVMIDDAKLSKPPIQNLADRVASYFVPVIVVLAIITLVIWITVGVTVRRQPGAEATTRAITYAIAVLIVSCPCAIGLAVPMVIVIASGVAAERGVILKSAESVEVAYRTSHVVFDKTGTLTEGRLRVAVEKYMDIHDAASSASLLLGLISSIKHPVSTAVTEHLRAKGVSASAVTEVKALTSKGVEGTAASGLVLRAGNTHWLDLSADAGVQPILSQGYTTFCFTINDSVAAVFGLEDSLRPDALSAIAKLHERKISVHIISGDDDGAVRAIASQLAVPNTNVRSRCTPAAKQAYIQRLLASSSSPPSTLGRLSNNKNKGTQAPVVIFCGDGTNDAPALAQATIGIHMTHPSGTDVAASAADVVLMRPTLAGVLTVIDMSKKAVHRIRLNFAWSAIYNLVAVLLAAGAFVHIRIAPQWAGLGESVSVLPVVGVALALRLEKKHV